MRRVHSFALDCSGSGRLALDDVSSATLQASLRLDDVIEGKKILFSMVA